MHNHWLFIGNVLAHWVAFMSSIVSFTIGIVEYVRNRKTEGWIFAGIAFLFLLVAGDAAWQDEHRNSQVLIAEKASLFSEKDFWKEQSYEKDEALRSRDELLAQNYAALIGEQGAANKAQESLANLSGKVLELGKPKPFEWHAMALESDEPGDTLGTDPPKRRERWILLANKDITPVEFQVSCNRPIAEVETKVAGTSGIIKTAKFSEELWGSQITSPAWGPNSPILVMTTLFSSSEKDTTCYFHLQMVTK